MNACVHSAECKLNTFALFILLPNTYTFFWFFCFKSMFNIVSIWIFCYAFVCRLKMVGKTKEKKRLACRIHESCEVFWEWGNCSLLVNDYDKRSYTSAHKSKHITHILSRDGKSISQNQMKKNVWTRAKRRMKKTSTR